MSFWTHLGVVLGSLVGPLGRPNRAKINPRGPKMPPRGAKIAPRPAKMIICTQKSAFADNLRKVQEKQRFRPPSGLQIVLRWPQARPRWPQIAPRRPQGIPKTVLERFFLQLLFRLRFWSVFAQLGLHLPPPGAPIGSRRLRDSVKILAV